MREILFQVMQEQPGHLLARAEDPPLVISAGSREALRHEAREALILLLGAAHAGWQVRLRSRSTCCFGGSGTPSPGGG